MAGRHRPAQGAQLVRHVRRELPREGDEDESLGGGAGASASASGSSPSAPCTAGTCGRWRGPAGRRTWTTRSKGWWRRRRRLVTAALAPVTAPLAAARTPSPGSRRVSTTRGSRGTPRCACASEAPLWAFPLWCASGACFVGSRAPGVAVRRSEGTRAAGCCGPCRSARVTSRSGGRRRATVSNDSDSPVSKGSYSSVSRAQAGRGGSGRPVDSSRTDDD